MNLLLNAMLSQFGQVQQTPAVASSGASGFAILLQSMSQQGGTRPPLVEVPGKPAAGLPTVSKTVESEETEEFSSAHSVPAETLESGKPPFSVPVIEKGDAQLSAALGTPIARKSSPPVLADNSVVVKAVNPSVPLPVTEVIPAPKNALAQKQPEVPVIGLTKQAGPATFAPATPAKEQTVPQRPVTGQTLLPKPLVPAQPQQTNPFNPVPGEVDRSLPAPQTRVANSPVTDNAVPSIASAKTQQPAVPILENRGQLGISPKAAKQVQQPNRPLPELMTPGPQAPPQEAVARSPMETVVKIAQQGKSGESAVTVAAAGQQLAPRRAKLETSLNEDQRPPIVTGSPQVTERSAKSALPEITGAPAAIARETPSPQVESRGLPHPTIIADGPKPKPEMVAFQNGIVLPTQDAEQPARPADTLPLIQRDVALTNDGLRPVDGPAKPPVKPFAEALISQVKAVEVGEGRTQVNLHPKGLGAMEVEIFGEREAATKVVVRVENPAVLQVLKDERHLLAQAIGISDSNVLAFEDRGAGNQRQNDQGTAGSTGELIGAQPAEDNALKHLAVVGDRHLDILT